MKKLLIIGSICVSISVAIIAVSCGLMMPIKQYATSDINDYGCYVGTKDNEFTSEYIGSFFPETIEDIFTDITYSYRAQNYANYAFEAYLEFVIEDEKAFAEFISAKTAGLEHKTFAYDPNFAEYTLNDTLEISVSDSEDNGTGKIAIHYARIGKILCNTKEHRIIFVAMAMRDAWDAYSDYFCCYFDRFNIDPTNYEGVTIR